MKRISGGKTNEDLNGSFFRLKNLGGLATISQYPATSATYHWITTVSGVNSQTTWAAFVFRKRIDGVVIWKECPADDIAQTINKEMVKRMNSLRREKTKPYSHLHKWLFTLCLSKEWRIDDSTILLPIALCYERAIAINFWLVSGFCQLDGPADGHFASTSRNLC